MKIQQGNKVKAHYEGTLEDGTIFDSSYQRENPITFQAGVGQMIPGFDNAVLGMEVGEKKTVTIKSEEAYGEHKPDCFSTRRKLPT
jgi:peptidylprolyl isomerase